MCCTNKMVIESTSRRQIQSDISFSPKNLKNYEEFICGFGSGFVNIVITFPINKIMFRQMLHGVNSQLALNQIKKEGLQFLYRGCFPPLLQKTTNVSLMFGSLKAYKSHLSESFPSLNSFIILSVAATLAGGTEALLTPLERVQTLLQDGHYNNKFKNTYHAFAEMRKCGFKEYYRGLTPILFRNSGSNIVFFGLRDQVRDFLPHSHSTLENVLHDFVTGAVVGALTSTIFYPANVIKTKMQVCYNAPFMTFSQAFKQTYEERGRSIRKMYMGVHINYSRAFISWGIINASQQLLKKYFFSGEKNS
ncbi:mitochondrial nicotinamide adenine dinucleotide transporter SLC25A51 [Parasteatoda tepidariorum]|uniref:mitochondrial nicotinamide adenine dinucleotide transporter SLC25A51 n=1 Tax=Parasteatoda tepidariorum TaxID=114398 RepID=UPI00077F80D2|nr:mitochondrial nicotinamide adenine dinucleotide transporter SLC25A51-like [Parasteatoda tepidariorum]XP_015922656.1 mitochondrial nicotinamide adenine dinucleotide transporter SLC25A51-like [Parasteatoda tepidariorum]